MNTLFVKLKHKDIHRISVAEFKTIIDCSSIVVFSQNNLLIITIETGKNEKEVLALFFDLFSLLFIYFGAYPIIETIEYNGEILDTSQWVGKYITRQDLFRHDLFITEINSETISQTSIDGFRKKNLIAITSLQYLTSADYVHVIADHRITLLFHIIDGICETDKNEIAQLQAELIQRYKLSSNKNEIGRYLPKVYAISKECFFNYHRKYNCEILKLLKINQYTFLRIITDTRNWNSHFLRGGKPDRLKKGTEMVIFFEIVQYMIRLKIANDIGIKIKEDNIKEYYYTIHDWILKVLYGREDILKSKTYITSKQWDTFVKQINQFIKDSKMIESSLTSRE